MSEFKLKSPVLGEKTAVKAYKSIENGVVGAYNSIENGVVSAYKKVEDKFVGKFLDKTADRDDAKE